MEYNKIFLKYQKDIDLNKKNKKCYCIDFEEDKVCGQSRVANEIYCGYHLNIKTRIYDVTEIVDKILKG